MKMETSGAFAAVRELQKTLEAVRTPLDGATEMLEEYQKTLAPIRESLNLMHTAYAPIFEATKTFDSLNIKSLKDSIIRVSRKNIKERPEYLTKNLKRLDDDYEKNNS